jgi:PTS system ascorbate-specific IIA component
MSTGILIVAHSPLASALRQCVLHVFPDSAPAVVSYDVDADAPLEAGLAGVRVAMAQLDEPQMLVLTDVFGATPCNVAQRIVDGVRSRLIAGVNLPMLLRAVTYRRETLDVLVARAMAGGTQGVMQVATTAPQNQAKKKNDQDHHDHQH